MSMDMTGPSRRGRVPQGRLFRAVPGGVWNIQVTLAGKTYSRSTRVRDRLAAMEIMEVFVETMKLQDPDFPPPPPTRWKDLPKIWARLNRLNAKKKHLNNVTILATYHCPEIQEVFLSDLTQAQVDRVIETYRERSRKGSVEAIVRAVRLLVAWAVQHRFRLPGCPAITFPDLQEEHQRRLAERKERQMPVWARGQVTAPPKAPLHPPSPLRSESHPEANPSPGTVPSTPEPVVKPGGIWFTDEDYYS